MTDPLFVAPAECRSRLRALEAFAAATGKTGRLTYHDGGRYTFGPDAPPEESFRVSLVTVEAFADRWAVFLWED